MAHVEISKAKEDLNRLVHNLVNWQHSRDSDSILSRQFGWRDFRQASTTLENLVLDVRPGHKLKLTVGKTAILGSDFYKGAYGYYTEHSEPLEPGSEIDVFRTEEYTGRFSDPFETSFRRTVLYAGNYALVVSIDNIAQTLCDQGSLEIVETQQAEQP